MASRFASIEQRLWPRAVPSETGCLVWTGWCDPRGYGVIRHNARRWKAHRVAYTLTFGDIPDGMIVMHSCDNPPCINPAHLSLGTDADDIADRDAKKRSATGDRHGSRTKPWATTRGERNTHARINEEIVRSIRQRRASGETFTSIARDVGMDKSSVSRIANGLRWSHVPIEEAPR